MFGDLFQLLQNLNALRPMWALLGVVKCTVRSSLLHAIFISLVFALLICIGLFSLKPSSNYLILICSFDLHLNCCL